VIQASIINRPHSGFLASPISPSAKEMLVFGEDAGHATETDDDDPAKARDLSQATTSSSPHRYGRVVRW
jgi:hypothetical protein